MRVYSGLNEVVHVVRSSGYYPSRLLAERLASELAYTLDCSYVGLIADYLSGCQQASEDIHYRLCGSDAEAVRGLLNWYSGEYSSNDPKKVCYTVVNLNTGRSRVFIHLRYDNKTRIDSGEECALVS